MIEDVMQSSLPSFIYSVRVSDMSQGSNPFRITSIRSLPDANMDGALKDLSEDDQEHLKGKHVVS
jgi:Ca2+-dependent lipid-binding protein